MVVVINLVTVVVPVLDSSIHQLNYYPVDRYYWIMVCLADGINHLLNNWGQFGE